MPLFIHFKSPDKTNYSIPDFSSINRAELIPQNEVGIVSKMRSKLDSLFKPKQVTQKDLASVAYRGSFESLKTIKSSDRKEYAKQASWMMMAELSIDNKTQSQISNDPITANKRKAVRKFLTKIDKGPGLLNLLMSNKNLDENQLTELTKNYLKDHYGKELNVTKFTDTLDSAMGVMLSKENISDEEIQNINSNL